MGRKRRGRDSRELKKEAVTFSDPDAHLLAGRRLQVEQPGSDGGHHGRERRRGASKL
jgi:hypothetical protein